MTPGHRHRIVHLKEGGALLHILQTPILRTVDRQRAERSKWVWGVQHMPENYPFPSYVLTPLGILHTLFGVTVEW